MKERKKIMKRKNEMGKREKTKRGS